MSDDSHAEALDADGSPLAAPTIDPQYAVDHLTVVSVAHHLKTVLPADATPEHARTEALRAARLVAGPVHGEHVVQAALALWSRVPPRVDVDRPATAVLLDLAELVAGDTDAFPAGAPAALAEAIGLLKQRDR